MLGAAAFMSAVIVLLSLTMLQAELAFSRARVHQLAAKYLAVGYGRAVSSLETQLETGIAAKTIDPRSGPFPASFNLPANCATHAVPCDFSVAAQVSVDTTQVVAPLGAPSGCSDPNADDCGHNLQANGFVDEGRVSALVTVTVSAPGGATLATRSTNITLRTFASAPYIAVASARDRTFDDVTLHAASGDDGGQPNGSSGASDTRVNVIYRKRTTGQQTAANNWQDASWSDGSANTSGWSP
ncbi:MAG: hypothetical protein M3Y21_08885 [Candidatus Eremiobacteraeota bacterium]|nr:hypothetical protein [Candidatus Eremiobacteraeota bacterium]